VPILTVNRRRIAEVDGAKRDVSPTRFGDTRRQHHDSSSCDRRDSGAVCLGHRKRCGSCDLRARRICQAKEAQQRKASNERAVYRAARTEGERHTKTSAEIHKAIEAKQGKPRGNGSYFVLRSRSFRNGDSSCRYGTARITVPPAKRARQSYFGVTRAEPGSSGARGKYRVGGHPESSGARGKYRVGGHPESAMATSQRATTPVRRGASCRPSGRRKGSLPIVSRVILASCEQLKPGPPAGILFADHGMRPWRVQSNPVQVEER